MKQQAPVGRLAAAAGSDGVAVLAVEHETSIQLFPEGQHQDTGGGSCVGAADRPSPRPKVSSRSSNEQHHRSVLEPVQLDEAGGRTRRSSSSSSTAADERRLMPPPPSAGTCAGQADHSAVVVAARPRSRGEGQKTLETLSGDHAVAVVTTVPPKPPRDAQDHPSRGGSRPSRRPPPPEGLRDALPRDDAIAPSLPAREVARLKRDTAPAGSSSGGCSDITARRMEAPDGDDASLGTLSVAGREEERLAAVPLAFPSRPEVEAGEGDGHGGQVAAQAGTGAGNGRRESAAELAMHLISAHREDVRSALAAARKDMDLVSKADKDRQPAALMEYAREVEGVLGQRMAAGAKLRQALDSYLALRQAARTATKTSPQSEGHGLQEGKLRAGGRALRT